MWRLFRRHPVLATVNCVSCRPPALVRLLVIAADSHADLRGAEGQREDSRSSTLIRQRCRDIVPVAPGNAASVGKRIQISRTMARLEGVRHLLGISVKIAPEHASPASSADPQNSIAYHSRAVAGCEDALVWQGYEIFTGVSESGTHNGNPCLASIMRYPDAKNKVTAFDGIAHARMRRIAED